MQGIARRTLGRRLAAAATGIVLVAAATACGGGSSGAGGRTHLVYRTWDDQQKIGLEKVMKAFEATHPNIDVSVELLPYDQYWTKLTADVVAGTAPDLFWMQTTEFPDFVTKGVLADLSGDIKDTSIYNKTVVDAYTYQGKLYGVPKDMGDVAMLYNKDLLAKAGITMPDQLTWAPDGSGTFLPLLRKLTVDDQGRHPDDPGFDAKKVKTWGFASWNHYQTQWMNWMVSNGGQLIDKPFGKFAFNSPQDVAALQWGVDLSRKYHVSPPATQTNPPTGQATEMFERGQVAIFPANNALLPYVKPAVKFQIGVASMPAGPAGRAVNVNGLSEAVYAKSRHLPQAKELARYLATPDAQKIMGDAGYVFPAIDSLSQGYVDYWKAQGIDVGPYVEERKGKTFNLPIVPGFSGAEQGLNQTFNQIYLGGLSPQKGADQAVKDANAQQK
ncbi:ABC transporter substrate-binding protein [Streptomyces sp. NBC_01198]|uniref:ABC transporter substrate-binding protein n=1 Tax=Streptomyces sp. NBC_01198 TaxID=2903769 RepID=UPI002E12E885|nr:sugar ABC transporter substrate-binding protein [Streptomyces sp. NBC_01198]